MAKVGDIRKLVRVGDGFERTRRGHQSPSRGQAARTQIRKRACNPISFAPTVFDSSTSFDGGAYHLRTQISDGLRRQEGFGFVLQDERCIGPFIVAI